MKIDRQVQQIVRTASPDEHHTFVIEWGPDTLPDLSGLRSRSERREALRSATEAAKEPLLSTLRRAVAFDLNEQAGTRHTAVAGTIAEWRKLFEEPVIQAAEGRVLPNATFRAD